MDKLRLLVVADVSPLELHGGSSRLLMEQSARLAARGHRVTVLCRRPAVAVPADSVVKGVRVVHYEVSRAHSLAYFWSSIQGAGRAYRRLLAGEPWERVILNQPLSALGVRRFLPPSAPRLYVFHSPASVEYRLRAEGMSPGRPRPGVSLAAALLRLAEGSVLRTSQRVVVMSQYMLRQLGAVHPRGLPPAVVIPGGVDLQHFQPAEDPMAVRRALGLPADRFLFLTVRDLHPRMGVETLIRAVDLVRQAFPLLLAIGGEGALRAELEALVERRKLRDHVRFLGHIPERDLPRYYQAADCFVLPTRDLEGFGLVTVEALACGTPVLGTPVGATPEILGPLAPELLTEDTSAESLARGLRRVALLCRDGALRARCRAHAATRYDWELSVDRLEGLLAGLASWGSR